MKKLYPTLILALSFLITSSLWSQGTVTTTYITGDIPSDKGFTSLNDASTCVGQLDVVIPAGEFVTSVDVAYDMTAGGGAWMSEQKSWIYCSSTAIGEAAVAGGTGAGAGTINYSRTGLTIADGASGTVSFELHAGRTWGGSGCGTNYNKIDDGTWTITVNHAPRTVTTTYTTGDIPSDKGFTSLGGASTCAGQLDVVIPAGDIVTSVDVAYDMTAGGGAWMSEQKSWIYCSSTAIGEAAVAGGTGAGAGTINYSRTGLTIADGASGTVSFELHAGRTWGGSGCGTNYNKIDDGTWTITVNHGPAPSCNPVTGLAASNLTTSSTDISWTAGGTETSWNFDYGPAGYTQGQGPSTIAANPNSLFVGGANATWSYIHPLVITTDGAASQAAQTYTINVTSLPTSGAKARLIKSTANGGAAFSPSATGQALVLGANTFTAAAVSFNRYVKIQFNNNQFEFDSIAVNGTSVYTSGTSVSATSISLSGLNAGTSYDAYVQSDCGSGDVSSWAGPFSFTTNTSPLSIPTCEDFESGLPGASTDLNAAVNASATVIAGAAANSSAYGVQLTGPDTFVSGAWTGGATSTTEAQAWGTNVTTHSNVAFNVDATAESVVILSFDLRQTYTFGPKYSWFRVTVNGTQIGASINPISNTDPFLNYSYDLSAYAGTSFDLKLEHAGKYSPAYNPNYPGDRALIDNICISAPNCLAPTALTASSITATTASASWSGTDATSYNIEYGPNGYTQGTGGTASTISASTTIASNPNSLFLAGPTAWPHVSNLALTADGASSQADQTFTINVTSLPTGGTNWRLIKQNSGSGASFVPTGSAGQPLVLGANTLTAPASTWNRYVKAQFQNNTFEFDAISINGISVYSSSNTSFTGLTPQTQYDIYVQSDCGSGGTSSWVGPLTFTTACGAAASPYLENFDSGFPFCWSQSTTDDFNWTLDASGTPSSSTGPSDDITGGGNYMFIETSAWVNGNEAVLLSQAIDLSSLSVPQLVFFSHMYGATVNTLTVDISTDAGATFTQVFTKTGQQGNQWNEEIVNLSSYSGTVLFKITASKGTSFSGDIAIDNFEIREAPACSAPTTLVASNLTATSAVISWTAGGTEAAWNFEYGTSPYPTPAAPSSVSATTSSLTGLSPQTTYDFYVRADCGSDQSIWLGPFTFTTTCAAATSPYIENFEGLSLTAPYTALPSCWTPQVGPDYWDVTNDITNNGHSYLPNIGDHTTGSGNYMWIDASGDITTNMMETGFIDVSGLSSPNAGFWFASKNITNAINHTINLDAWDGSAWVNVATESGNFNDWVEVSGDLPAGVPTTTKFRIQAIAATGTNSSNYYQNDLGVDDFFVRETPSCLSPTSLAASNITTNSADLSWTAGGTETAWNFEYGPVGFTQGSGTSIPLASANISLTGLTTDTQYHAYVQADCGRGNTSVWVGPYTFSTLPNPSCRYTMNMIDSYGDSWNGASIDVSINGAYVASFSNPSSAAANAVYTDTISAYTGDSVSFSWTSGSYDGEVSFEILDPTFTSLTAGYIAAPPAGFFLADANSPSVCAPPACQVPILLTASNLTPNSADISWTAGGTETAWNFEYGPAGFTQGTGTISALSSANTSLTGLTANTQYDVYVQADCGSGTTSGWTGPFTFTTACDILNTFPYTMDFENGFGCWDVLDLASANTWQLTSGSGVNASVAAQISYSSAAHDDHLISPKFSVTANSSRFSFNSRNGSPFYNEKFDVLVSTTGKNGADFTDTLVTGVIPPTSYEYYQYDLSSYIGQDVFVSIHATEQDQLYLYVDDVTIDEYVSKTITQNETSCNPTYSWSVNGTTYSSDTNLTVFSPAVNVADADSTFILNLAFSTSYSDTLTVTACDSYTWRGNPYTFTDFYRDTLVTVDGCDSILNLDLTINNSTSYSENAVACDSYVWNGTTYNTTGNYSFLTTNSNGCDSNVTLTLTVNYSGSSSISITECGSYDWSISQTTYDSSGVYINSDTTSAGCSQIDTLVLTINPEYTDTISVTACDTYTWLVNGNTYTSSTTSDSLYQSINGCDSLVTLDLTIINSTIGTETVTACDSAIWNGTTYTSSGNYSFNASPGSNSCDSTANLVLVINPSSSSSISNTACNSYFWEGTNRTSTGTYTDINTNAFGCPQYDTLVLTVNPTYNDTVSVTACDSSIWDGTTYTTSGTYTNTYQTSLNCDSIVTLNLTINNSNIGNETVTACDSYVWNGTTYTSNGNYSYNQNGTLTNNVNCDSTANLTLVVNSSSSSSISTTACNSYFWEGTNRTSTGTYTDINTNNAGCPQYDTLVLTITTTGNLVNQTVCDSFPWNGTTYTTSGVYEYQGVGCVDSLFLTVNQSSSSTTNLTACDSSIWNGITYTSSGNYTFFTTNSFGCDSTATLNLNINNSVSNTITNVVCDSYDWNGSTYTTSGNYPYTTLGSNNCDSTVNLILTVNSSTSSTDTQTNCGSYFWNTNGNTYNSSGIYVDTAINGSNCPQYDTLVLTINPGYNDTISLTVCDSLLWNGVTYTTSGLYTNGFILPVTGCDSIVTLILTVNNSSESTQAVSACDSYDWNGTTYTSSGNYSLGGLTNNVGCDSTANLNLTVNLSSSSLLTTTSCNSYFWKGNLLDSSGIYSVTGTNLFGCNQYDTLDLTISTFVSSNDVVTACDSYDWGGLTYFTSGAYSQTGLTSSTGCDSIANLNLTINSSVSNTLTEVACDSYNWNGMTYTTSGVYSGVFQTSTGCDSTVNLVLTINSSSNQSVTVFSCDEYTWDGVSYTASGDYTNNYTTASGCDSTVTLVLTLGTTAAPFTEGFDINFPNCWSQPDSIDGEDALDWTRNSFATFSPGTGPSDDVIGGGHYMYIESSLPAQHGDNAIMYSNFIDISSLTNPELRFFSHMYGESTGSLTVEIQGENDTVPTTIFSKSGDHGDLWVQERVIFTSTSNRVKFKITGILDSNSLGAVWAGDMAIDEFGVREAVPNDLAIIAAAVNSDCELTTTEPIELWVVNNGLVDQANFKLSYSINGGAPVLDSIIQFVNIGDTLRHTFTATADMSMDGIYDIDFECILAIDADATDNVLNFVAENYTTPVDAVTLDDTICFIGDFGQVSAISDGWIYWYDSLVGGSLVGEGDTLFVTPSATTSYFAEVSVYDGFEEDFESYSSGDLIAQSSNDWNTWSDPNGGADDDAEVTDFVSAGGSNSLYLSDDNGDDIVLPLGNTYSSGVFSFKTDMYIETNAYLNFQEGVVNGEAWAFDLYFTDTVINVEIDDSTVLTVAYNPNNPLGAPVWFNFDLQADLDNGQWKMFKDGVSLGSFAMYDQISSVNFWASTGNDYYIDNVEWSAWGGDACRSLSRTEAVVVLDSCNTTSVSEVSFENLKIYPNPNNGSFTIANSELINSVVIMDLQGKVVYRNSNLNLYNLNVNLENLDRGMYMINIISENEIITKSIIVN